jgi:antitoxin HicB
LARYTYSVLLIPDTESGGFVVEVPALPGCVTQGETVEEAMAMAENAISMWIREMAADGETIPVEHEVPRLVTVGVER